MRIALIGKGGTGKTTLAKILAVRLSLPLINEQFRDAANALGIRSVDIQNLSKHERAHLQGFAVASQIAREEHLNHFVSDRSVLDYHAYYKATMGEPVLLSDFAVHRMAAYTHVFYVPPFSVDTPIDDGFRPQSPEWIEIERSVGHTLETLSTRHAKFYRTLTKNTIDERLDELIMALFTHSRF